MSRLFISHSSRNDDWAIALRDWLVNEGWSGSDDIFLDLDLECGIAAGQRWAKVFEDAATETANRLVFDLARRFCDVTGVPVALIKDMLDRARHLQEQLT